MSVLTPRRYPASVTVDQARAGEDALSYYLGTSGMGNGDAETTAKVRELVEIFAGVRVEDEAKQRRRDALYEALVGPFRDAFRDIKNRNPGLSSRVARAMAAKEIAR